MKLDLPIAEQWENLNDFCRDKLSIQAPQRVRVYKDISSAIFEIAQGTAQFFAHKKSVAFLKGQTPIYEFLLPYFYKESFQVQNMDYHTIHNIKEWVDGLNKDTSFVVFAEDHPVTGEVYTYCDELDRLLNEKKIYSFRISHNRFRYEALEIRPYSVQIRSYTNDLCIAICGERFRSPTLLAHRQNWNVESMQSLVSQQMNFSIQQNSVLVENFENEIHQKTGAVRLFQPGSHRLFDRAVLAFCDVSAEALAVLLFKKMNIDVTSGWQLVETTNMCRWNSLRMYQWWSPMPANNVLRGLLIFNSEVLSRKDFANVLISSYEEIKAQQEWS